MKKNLKLAAIDLDGTLLSPDLGISPENREAVARLQAAGLHTVIATGRHYANFRHYFSQLPGIEWLVSAQGSEVSDLQRETIVAQAYLDAAVARAIYDDGIRRGFSQVVYAEDDIYTVKEDHWIGFYKRIAGRGPAFTDPEGFLRKRVFKIIWMGEEASIAALPLEAGVRAFEVSQVRTHEYIHEFLPRGTTKGTGVAALARHLGILPGETVVFGDAENDIPMFEWAGWSFAMPHAWDSVKRAATEVAPDGPPESAFARAVGRVLA